MCSYLVGLEVQFCFNLSSTHFGYARTRLHLCAGFISLLIGTKISCRLFKLFAPGKLFMLFVVRLFFQNQLFRKIISGILSESQTHWIQIRPDILSGLIWVQPVCKGYEQTTLVGKEFMLFLGKQGLRAKCILKVKIKHNSTSILFFHAKIKVY